MAAEAIVENGLIVRGTAGHRLFALLNPDADAVQPLAGDLADVLRLVDPKAKIAVELGKRIDEAKAFARANREGPKWVGLTVEATTAEVRDLLKAAGAKV